MCTVRAACDYAEMSLALTDPTRPTLDPFTTRGSSHASATLRHRKRLTACTYARAMLHSFVEAYRARGWATIRVAPLAKNPVGAWQDRTDEPNAFVDGDNVGVRLGDPSGGLVDVDLDCPEAVALAGRFLPATAAFGRGGETRHYLYVCPGARTAKPQHVHVELRSTGLQTVLPGSRYAAGPVEWYTWGDGPRTLEVDELMAAFGRLCAAVLVARAWPRLAGQRHDAVLALAGALWHSGWTCDDARDLLLPAMGLDGSDEPHRAAAIADTWANGAAGREGVWGWPTVRRLLGDAETAALERAVAWVLVARPAAREAAGDERPEVDLSADQLDVLDAVGQALVGRPGAHGLYRQGTALATLDGGATAHRVAVELARACRFVRQTQKARVPAHVPLDLAGKVAADPPALPELVGRRATPVLRPDGSVWSDRGYDVVTGVWCEGWTDPRVVAMGRDEAAAACGRLLAFIWADQFVEHVDAMSWLAHLLTVAARPALVSAPVPAWVYSAAMSGSGKSALAKTAGVLGGRCGKHTSPQLKDEDELARRLDGHALDPAVVLDNLREPLRSEVLEGAVTEMILPVRRLYAGPARVPWRCVLAVTSNGAAIGHDWVRRSMPVRLNSARLPTERNVADEAALRPDLTADAVGIVAGWLRSGGVYDGVCLAGFPEWSAMVAGAIRWATTSAGSEGVDVVSATREASADMVSADDDGGILLDRIEAWLVSQGRAGGEFFAKEIYDAPSLMDLRQDFSSLKSFAMRLGRCGDGSRVLVRRKSNSQARWKIQSR